MLIRHGQAAAAWDQDHDPGLDDVGRKQADAMASAIAPHGPRPLVVSPLRRTRETAAALEAVWNATARVEPSVGEIPSPTDDLGARGEWLRAVMRGTWPTQPEELQVWRDGMLDALRAMTIDTVVVTHFIAINAAVGAATGDDRLVCFAPDNCSCTVLDVGPSGALTVVELGAEATTVVF